MKLQIFLFGFVLSYSLQAQFALVDDPDGYTNLRTEPSTASEIICKVPSERVLFVEHEFYLDSSWVLVYFDANPFGSTSIDHMTSFSSEGPVYKGYIHRSRLKSLDKLPNSDAYELRFKLEQKPNIEDLHQDPDRNEINGLFCFGTDGVIANAYRTTRMQLINEKDTLEQSPILFQNLFNISFNSGWISSKNQSNLSQHIWKDLSIFIMHASDGAGGYSVIWVVSDNRIVQRWLGFII